jgi:hypothetical protein
LNHNESGRSGALKSVYIIMSFDFPFVRLFGNFVITLIIHRDYDITNLYRTKLTYVTKYDLETQTM